MIFIVHSFSETPGASRLKPVITVYTRGSPNQTKRFDSLIAAAFWAGVDYSEEDLKSVRIRQPGLSDESELANLVELATLLVQRQVDFTVEFSNDSRPASNQPRNGEKPRTPLLEPTERDEIPNQIPTLKED